VPRGSILGRVSIGGGLALVGLALVAAGVFGVVTVVGRWVPLRALVAESGQGALWPFLLLLVGALVFLGGLVVYVFAPAGEKERAAASHASLPMILASLAVAAVVANVVGLAFLLATGRAGESGAPSPLVIVASIVPLDLSLLGVLYLRIVRPGVLAWRDLGLTTERLALRAAQGFGCWLLLLAAVVTINALLQSLGIAQTQRQLFLGIRSASLAELLALTLAGGVLAPVVEEAFFRGYVFTAYLRAHGRLVAYLVSAGLFSLVHLNLEGVPAFFVAGLVFALALDRTRSLVPSIVAHGLNNTFAFAVLYLVPS
jgi:membrane protease YdiL (CAAX protease family)